MFIDKIPICCCFSNKRFTLFITDFFAGAPVGSWGSQPPKAPFTLRAFGGNPRNISGWCFQPLRKILVNWDD